ncbi:MAG: sodium:solute symporter, partial [Victivallaceae bacterium]
MSPIDWLIVASLMAPLIWLLFRCNREVKNTSDFLTAGRCAGRYLLSISGGIGSFGLISAIAMFELYYNGGLATLYWGWLSGPLAIAAALSGWIYYRYRETRCMTVAQFLEVRYNRRVRILAGTLAWVAGVTNYGIFPAVGARFIIHFCRLPERFELGGMTWDLYPLMLGLIISTGIFFAIMGGQIAIMITDFAQGMFCNLAFLVLLVFFAVTIKWETVSTALSSWGMAHPEQSMINPFKTS